MLKTLIKKQLLELNAFYFLDRKTGKRRSKNGIIGMAVLYIIIFAFLAITFASVSMLIAAPLIESGMGWLYFAMMGLMSILLGVFGGVFNTYAGLYHAKDNDLLLAMPIPPSKILAARLTGVYAMGFLYEALVFIPSIIVYWIFAKITPLNVIFPILLLFIIGFLVMSLTCALGWVVALISSKLKNKSIITVIISVVFFFAYYFVCMRLNNIIQSLISNIDAIGEKVKAVYPFYLMGLGADGKVFPMLGFTAMVAAFTALTCFIMSRTFVKIVTARTAEKKTAYKETNVKAGNESKALLRKELKRFTSSPTYMLNTGLGIAIFPVLAVLAVIKADEVKEMLSLVLEEAPFMTDFLPISVIAAACLMLSMNAITAPSISLEGKNLWILQALPVDPWNVLQAKEKLHIYLNVPVAAVSVAVIGFAFDFEFTTIIYMIVAVAAFELFTSAYGLVLNLKKPNLTWTNETVPVKQGFSVTVHLFSGWGIVLVFGAASYALFNLIGTDFCILGFAIIMILIARVLNGWLRKTGTKIFAEL